MGRRHRPVAWREGPRRYRAGGVPDPFVDLDLGMGDVFTYYGKEPEKPLSDIVALGEKPDRELVMATASQLHHYLWGFSTPQDPAVEEVSGEAMGKALRAVRDTFPFT